MDKYYTPTIKEFHVGFEYEMYDDNGDGHPWWQDFHKWWGTLDPNENSPRSSSLIDYKTLDEWVKDGRVRIKYLDRSDIEGLGFSITSRDNEEVIRFTINEEKNIVGFYHPDAYKLGIYSVVELGKNEHFFGEIKNKSELKVLLRQLNII